MKAIQPTSVLDQKRFTSLWRSLSERFDAVHCEQVYRELVIAYTSPERHYHNDRHICLCLSRLDEQRKVAGHHAPLVEMAIWFHDSIYTPGDPQNEYKSAVWFKLKANNHLRIEVVDTVVSLIVATTHRDRPISWREQLTVDVDLSSFALPRERFLEDSDNIRKEFHNQDKRRFIENQNRFLQELLDRPVIYFTGYFFDKYEDAARDNIQHLLGRYNSELGLA